MLLITKQPPSSDGAQDYLDAALACAAMGTSMELLLLGDAVLQLSSTHTTPALKERLSMCPLYGIENIYVCEKAMHKHQLSGYQIDETFRALTTREIAKLIAKQHHTLHF